MDEIKKYWVGFSMIKGIGPIRIAKLIDFFGDLDLAWQASDEELLSAGLSMKLVRKLREIQAGNALEILLDRAKEKEMQIITWDDDIYPRRLRDIEQSPPVLFLRGTLKEEDQWAVSVVGTRRVTQYGRQVAHEIGSQLAQAGITVISGLARGVDGIAHHSALQAGGRTIGVLGSGVDIIYPPEHRKLAKEIIQSGALISDYPPGAPPEAANFPARNRIISGLCRAVVVVEAGERSGALITAAFAAEQGREIFAVPGNIYAPHSQGTNRLIRQGAHLFLDTQDLIETINLTMVSEHKVARKALPANADEAHLYEILSKEPLHIDEIQNLSQMPVEKVAATLSIMELKGLVKQVGSMRYLAVFERRMDYLEEQNGEIKDAQEGV